MYIIRTWAELATYLDTPISPDLKTLLQTRRVQLMEYGVKLAIIALLIILGIWLLAATIKHPREALGFMLMLATVSLIEVHPWIALVGFLATAMVAVLAV